MHTGCEKRLTGKPLSVSLIKFIFKFGLEPCFVRLMTEYYLECALELAEGCLSTLVANQAMGYLVEASKYAVILADSQFWPDADKFPAEFASIRTMLEDGLAAKAGSNLDSSKITVPNLEEMERLPSPEIILEEMPHTDSKHDDSEPVILRKSKENLGWIPSYDLKSLEVKYFLIS
jgi:hypothetical protein